MNVTVDSGIYRRLEAVAWFAACGGPAMPELAFECELVLDRAAGLASFRSELWSDIKTEAQGNLTGYLAKHHYNAYGGLQQMSDSWIRTNMDNLLRSNSAYARSMGALLEQQKYQHKFINVMNAGGESFMYPW